MGGKKMAEKEYIERYKVLRDWPLCDEPADAYQYIKSYPAADVRPVVLCRDCLHYEMGVCLKIYDDGAANKDAWQERKPDDYCSYGEDRNVPTNCRTDMRPTSMSGANGEGKHENRAD